MLVLLHAPRSIPSNVQIIVLIQHLRSLQLAFILLISQDNYGHIWSLYFLNNNSNTLVFICFRRSSANCSITIDGNVKIGKKKFFGNFKKVYYIMIMFESFYHPSITYATLFFFFKKKKTHKTILIYIPSILMNSDFASTGS